MNQAQIHRVTVYCASSNRLHPAYGEAAQTLGRLLAEGQYELVYGGGSIGLMGTLADAVHAAGGRIHGIITGKLMDLEQGRETCDILDIVDTMRQRREQMEDLADAFITLPGGLGTYEELFEILVSRVLDEHRKPVVAVNTRGYFDALAAMLEKGVSEGFIKPQAAALLKIVPTPAEAIACLANGAANQPHVDDLIPSR